MTKTQLVARVEGLRKRSNMLLRDIQEVMTTPSDFDNSAILDLKTETRELEQENLLLEDCAELIESKELSDKLFDIKYVLDEADAKRAVHLDRLIEERQS
jgi:hypothetical protein